MQVVVAGTPLISVVIPCYNAERWVAEAIASVKRQSSSLSASVSVEIVVIDDGSVDTSASIVAQHAPNARLIRTAHVGASRARNVGTQAAQGQYIQYLDADDVLAPGKLQRQLDALVRTGAEVAYGDWQKLRVSPSGVLSPAELVEREMNQKPELALLLDFWCPPAAYLFRRSIVDRVGGWNEELPIIQDARFVLDCALRGATFVYTPGVQAYYRVHQSDSLSTRDRGAFVRDCLRNAVDVQRWWEDNGGIDAERRHALMAVYESVARASFERDRSTFREAFAALNVLKPGYIPDRPAQLAITARVLGYERAEELALIVRRMRRRLAGRLSA